MYIFFKSELTCEAILVTDDIDLSETTDGGLYFPSDKRAPAATENNHVWEAAQNNPVWKRYIGDQFIFNTGGTEGWRVGPESGLMVNGNYFCKGKHILFIFNAYPKRSTTVFHLIEF